MVSIACRVCKLEKPLNGNFNISLRHRTGHDTKCRACINENARLWKAANSERLAARRRAQYAETHGARHRDREIARHERQPFKVSAQRLRDGVRERGKILGLDVSPELRTASFIEAWLRRQPSCECCGVAFMLGPKDGSPHDTSPSIDRFDARHGYTLHNSALICWRCNNIKRNYVEVDLRCVADWMERRRT
jgi:hypothetical protein